MSRDTRQHDERHDDKRIQNRDQDPDHPANKTQPSTDEGHPRPRAEAFNIPPEELMTEQEKDAGNPSQGIGPAAKSEHTSGPVTTIEDQNIAPREPYPTGNPPEVGEITTRSQAVKGVTDQKGESPSDSKGTAGTTRKADKEKD